MFLKERNERFLVHLDQAHPAWRRLKSLLKNLRVRQKPTNAVRVIRSLRPRAGQYEFTLDDGQSITVAVSILFCCLSLLVRRFTE